MNLSGGFTRDRHSGCRARIEALEAENARMRKLLLEYRAVAQQNSAGTPAGCDSQRWYKEEIAAIDAAIGESDASR